MGRFRKSFVYSILLIPCLIVAQDISEFFKEMEEEWKSFEKSVDITWQDYEEEIRQKWNEFVTSTREEWVDYSDDFDVRSRVNFKDGYVEVSALVPSDSKYPDKKAKKMLTDGLKRTLSSDNPSNMSLLKDQIKMKTGEYATEKDASELIKESKVQRKKIKSEDGKDRFVYTVRIDLLPDHIKRRAMQFKDYIERYAYMFEIEPALVMAIIHTESYFNPLAVSKAGAYGLMQLIPRYGARDAYRHITQEDWVPPKEVLFNPKYNILLGTGYIDFLESKFFSNLDSNEKVVYLLIASYNWGPSRVTALMKREGFDTKRPEEVYNILEKKSPQETRDYLKKVLKRRDFYRKFVGG